MPSKPTKPKRTTPTKEPASRKAPPDLAARIRTFAESVREDYDTRPVTKAEWDRACGDTGNDPPNH